MNCQQDVRDLVRAVVARERIMRTARVCRDAGMRETARSAVQIARIWSRDIVGLKRRICGAMP